MGSDLVALSALTAELNNTLSGARVDKIVQPDPDELRFFLRNGGKNLCLCVSCNAGAPRMHITSTKKQNPLNAPSLCMLLRKHLQISSVEGVSVFNNDRILQIKFNARTEMKDDAVYYLFVEIMNRYSNIVFTDEKLIILDAVKHLPLDATRSHVVLRGVKYEPVGQNKISYLTNCFSVFDNFNGGDLHKFILDNISGFSGVTVSEIISRAGLESNHSTSLNDDEKDAICAVIKEFQNITESELEEGPGFAEVMREFRRWCGDDAVFLTWGPDDTSVLRQNLDFYGMEIQWMTHWYDLQLIFNRQTGNSGQKSLAFAAEHFNIDQCLPLHNALNDAYYTALVCEELDLETGIATYPNLAEHRFTSSAVSLKNQMYDGFETKLEALRDSRVRFTSCPDCGEKMLSKAFTHQTTNKYITLAECAEHGKFLVQVRFSRGKTLKAWKTVYRANEDAEKMYLARLNEKKVKKAKTAAK